MTIEESNIACPDCGYLASKRGGYQDKADVSEKEYIMRVEKALDSSDIRPDAADITEEFRRRAHSVSPDELWLLIDPDTDEIIDAVVGEEFGEE